MKKNQAQSGFGKIDVILSVVAVILLGLIVGIVISHTTKPAKTAASSKSINHTKPKYNFDPKDTYATLSPAISPSNKAECAQAVTTAQNGSPVPVTCANGDLNISEWQALEKIYPASVMVLYPSASLVTIEKTVCIDLSSGKTSVPIEDSAYHIASLYYGWKYQANLVANDKC